MSGVERIIGTDGIDLIALPTDYTNGATIEGLGGNDVLVGSNNRADTILGGTGDDVVAGRGGNDRLAGGAGADQVGAAVATTPLSSAPMAASAAAGTLVVDTGTVRTMTLTNARAVADTVNGGADIDTILLTRGN